MFPSGFVCLIVRSLIEVMAQKVEDHCARGSSAVQSVRFGVHECQH